jgi:hypothetical protein
MLLTRRNKSGWNINGGDNSIDSKNTNRDRRAIHIYGRMEHNLAKYYSFGHTNLSKNNEFTRETYHTKRDFSTDW